MLVTSLYGDYHTMITAQNHESMEQLRKQPVRSGPCQVHVRSMSGPVQLVAVLAALELRSRSLGFGKRRRSLSQATDGALAANDG